ncbi:MAG: 5'/3'-nucleotidase SurE [Marinifilaceae bacterium]|jgi:5'-nucleotidase|nr:5'/3'-nucleotidase SurE [Marinifilaceae bacterium]
MNNKPVILITNDDGISAPGIRCLIDIVKDLAKVYVVAPDKANSGKSSSITVEVPIRIKKLYESESLIEYSCNGTPVDCVKIALNQILPERPDLLLSGINHGSNSSVSVHYSGTMGAVIEACVNSIPAIGFSINSFSRKLKLDYLKTYLRKIIVQSLNNKMDEGVCLNVNIPETEIKGIKICRQAKGKWQEEFDKRTDPYGGEYYWLTGYYQNKEQTEPNDTDEFALNQSYISIVPTQIDLTAYDFMEKLNCWDLD